MCVEIHNNPQTHPAGMCWSSGSCNPVGNNRQGTYKYSDYDNGNVIQVQCEVFTVVVINIVIF